MLSAEKRAEINDYKIKSGVNGPWMQTIAVVNTLLAIHDELELIRGILYKNVVPDAQKPSTGKAKG